MVNVLISFSRITLLSFVIVFTIIDLFQIFENRLSEVAAQILSTIQSVMVVLFLVNASIILYMARENDFTIIVLMILQLLLFGVTSFVLSRLAYISSRALINNVFMLLSFSFIALERLKMPSATRQFVFTIISVLIASLVVAILRKIRHIDRMLYIFGAFGVLLLLLVSFLGKVEYGAKLSLSFGSISIQPSEFVKLLYLFFISGCIVYYKDIRGILISLAGVILHVLILVSSRDLGTALIFLATYLLIIFIAYKNYIVLFLGIGAASIGGLLALKLFPHIQNRFIAWSDPLSVVDDKGYQISQSLFAIGTGGWLGSGLTNGMPNKIPVVTKDFIFAAISEEMGAIVGICLIMILLSTTVLIFNKAFSCTNSFYMLVTSGIAIIFAIQTILNIGGVIKFIPSTGVTLPFVSYGGSSLLSMFICFFITECSDELIYVGKGRRYYD